MRVVFFFLSRKFGFSEKVVYLCIRELVTHINYGGFDFVSLASFIIALAVGPFIVGSCNPVLWVFYLGLCTMLTPLLGIPIYKAIFR